MSSQQLKLTCLKAFCEQPVIATMTNAAGFRAEPGCEAHVLQILEEGIHARLGSPILIRPVAGVSFERIGQLFDLAGIEGYICGPSAGY